MLKVKFVKVLHASDKQTLMDFVIISLLVSVPLAQCLMKKTLETRELHIALDTDDHLLDPSKIPSCSNGEKILLKTYEYEYAECDYIDECAFSNKDHLLPREKLRLHEMCSFQDICRNFSFLSRTSLQKSRTNAVLVKYQCIGPRTNIVDICETQTVAFNDAFYLTINTKEVSRNKYCQCRIQSGSFALVLHDVRLKITGKDNCSSARLHINRREFSCKPNRTDFGSKFGTLFNPQMANAYIGFSYGPDDDKPEMLMLLGKPKETVSVFCSSSSQTQVNSDSQSRKQTLINQISTTSDSQDLASEVSSDWLGTKTTTVETTEILTNYTTISNTAYVAITYEGSTTGNTAETITSSTTRFLFDKEYIKNYTELTELEPTAPSTVSIKTDTQGETDSSPILAATVSASTVLLVAAITTTIIVVVHRKRATHSDKTNAEHGERLAANTETIIHVNRAVRTMHAQTPMEGVFHTEDTRDQRNIDIPTASSFNGPLECNPDVDMYWEIGEVEGSNETYYEQLDLGSEQKDANCTKTDSKILVKDKCHFSQPEAIMALTVSNVKPRTSEAYEDNITDEKLEYFHLTCRHSNGYMQPIFVRSQNNSPVEIAAELEGPDQNDYLQPIYNQQKDVSYTELTNEPDTSHNHYYLMPTSASGRELLFITKAAEPESIENSEYLQPLPDREKEEFQEVKETVPGTHENM